MATERQIRHAVGAAATAWLDMVQLEGRVRAPAVHSPVLELLQEIGAHLPAGQFPALVLDPGDLWLLQELGVELHALHRDAYQRDPAPIAGGPGQDVVDA